jgi:hypothetical protein
MVYIGELPPDKLYPHTHLREALVYGLVGFIAGTTSCTMTQHHRFGDAAFTTRDSDSKCLGVGGGVASVIAMYNLGHDLSMVWGKGQDEGGSVGI